jgi:hypothetical protein
MMKVRDDDKAVKRREQARKIGQRNLFPGAEPSTKPRRSVRITDNAASHSALSQCPKKNKHKVCKCQQLCSSPSDIDNIRGHYKKIKENHNREVVNALLMSMMVPVKNCSRKTQGWVYKVPSLHDGKFGSPQWCRIFYPCRRQFMLLMGLHESRMQRLMDKNYYRKCSGDRPFSWAGPPGGKQDDFHAFDSVYPGREL